MKDNKILGNCTVIRI